jgi:hypothetical protein
MWLPTKTGKSNNQANYRVHCLPISHRHDFSVALDATLSDATLSDATLFSDATLSNATLSDATLSNSTGWYSSSSRRTLSSK